MNLANIGHWAFVLGLILSAIAGLGGEVPALITTLVVLGLVVGFLNVSERESTPFLIAVIALLVIGVAGLGVVKYVGWLVPILNNVIAFVGAAGLVVAVKQVLTMAKRSE